MNTQHTTAPSLVAVAITVIGWASSFAAIRAGLRSFGPLELGALRFAITAVPCALYLIAMRPALPRRNELWRFAVGGVFFIGLYTALLNIGEETVAAGAASFIINVSPIITAILATVILGERFSVWAWGGTLLSFGGIGLIALGESGQFHLDTGALLILGAAFCTGVTTIVQKPLFTRHRPLTVAAWNMLIGALCLSFALPAGLSESASASPEAIFALIYLAVVPGAISYAAWAIALAGLPAARAANFLYCIPPVATLIGYLWLGEVPGPLVVLGGALALGGVAIVNLKR